MKTRPESVHNNSVKSPNLQGQTRPQLGQKTTVRQRKLNPRAIPVDCVRAAIAGLKDDAKELLGRLDVLETAVRKSEALELLLLIAVDSDDGVQTILGKNGRFVAGIQSLMWHTQTDVALASKVLREKIHQLAF